MHALKTAADLSGTIFENQLFAHSATQREKIKANTDDTDNADDRGYESESIKNAGVPGHNSINVLLIPLPPDQSAFHPGKSVAQKILATQI